MAGHTKKIHESAAWRNSTEETGRWLISLIDEAARAGQMDDPRKEKKVIQNIVECFRKRCDSEVLRLVGKSN